MSAPAPRFRRAYPNGYVFRKDLTFAFFRLASAVMRTTVESLHKLISHINRKAWWHVPPADPFAYRKRGKFYASSFREAEFWGRPVDQPEQVRISNPLVGDEGTIEIGLLGRVISMPDSDRYDIIKWRHRMDERMKRRRWPKVILGRASDRRSTEASGARVLVQRVGLRVSQSPTSRTARSRTPAAPDRQVPNSQSRRCGALTV
jgi:hypothetical protein